MSGASDRERGTWITFEGIEGSGKTTQISRLASVLESRGHDVRTTREPGGTAIGARIRSILLDPSSTALHPVAELLLYTADRAQHIAEVVAPALRDGAIVLCDRFLDATLAYQGAARGLGAARVLELHREPPLDRRPHRTLLLDLDASDGLRRARTRNDATEVGAVEGRFEAEELAFHERVRRGYLELAEAEPGRFRIVDATGSVDAVHRNILQAVDDLFAAGTR